MHFENEPKRNNEVTKKAACFMEGTKHVERERADFISHGDTSVSHMTKHVYYSIIYSNFSKEYIKKIILFFELC